MIKLVKPHLALGNEYHYADASQYDQCGGAPALPGAREAYDRLDGIFAPSADWTPYVCWFVGGEISLTVRGPERVLKESTTTDSEGATIDVTVKEQEEARFKITKEQVEALPPSSNVMRPGINATVVAGGVEATSALVEFSTYRMRPREPKL